jgi:hypothetical protein
MSARRIGRGGDGAAANCYVAFGQYERVTGRSHVRLTELIRQRAGDAEVIAGGSRTKILHREINLTKVIFGIIHSNVNIAQKK